MYVTEYIIDFSFLLLSILLYEYTIIFIHSLSTHSLVDTYLDCFQVLLIINRTSMSIDENIFMIKLKVGIGGNILNLLKGT